MLRLQSLLILHLLPQLEEYWHPNKKKILVNDGVLANSLLINTSIIIIDLSSIWNSIGSMHLLPGSLLLVLFFYIALLSAVCFLFLIIKLCLKTLKIIKALYLPFVIFVFF